MLEMAVKHHTVLFRLTRVMARFSFQVDYSFLFIPQILNDHALWCSAVNSGLGVVLNKAISSLALLELTVYWQKQTLCKSSVSVFCLCFSLCLSVCHTHRHTRTHSY